MALPITHIALTEKVFDRSFKEKEQKALFVGSMFADINHLGVLSRAETHLKVSSIQEVQSEPSSFRAGMLWNYLVDRLWARFYQEKGVYTLADGKIWMRAHQFLEDEQLKPFVKDWPETIGYFDGVIADSFQLVWGVQLSRGEIRSRAYGEKRKFFSIV